MTSQYDPSSRNLVTNNTREFAKVLGLQLKNWVTAPKGFAQSASRICASQSSHTGTCYEVMSRSAAPMVGGKILSTILTLAVTPAIYALVKQWRLAKGMEVWGGFIAIIALAEFGCIKWR